MITKPVIKSKRGFHYGTEAVKLCFFYHQNLRAGIPGSVTPYRLRYSFAAHLPEPGADLRYIQEWLGHNTSKTTERYTHVFTKDIKRFKNPIDDFE